MKRIVLIVCASLLALSAAAKIELTPLFTDNMVFQQNCKAPVWGKAAPGATVTVVPSWNNKTYTAVAKEDGSWKLRIDTPRGSFNKYSLTISDGTPVVLQNVVVGEVWLASGQSNMERTFSHDRFPEFHADAIKSASEWQDVRMLTVARATGMVGRDGFSSVFGGWQESSPDTMPGW